MRFVLVSVLLIAVAVPAVGQQPSHEEDCTAEGAYETCALRLESVLLGTRIVRGQRGRTIGGLGLASFFAPDFDLEGAVGSSPRARVHAERYRHRIRVASRLGTGASVLLWVALGAGLIPAGDDDTRGLIVGTATIGFVGLTAASLPVLASRQAIPAAGRVGVQRQPPARATVGACLGFVVHHDRAV